MKYHLFHVGGWLLISNLTVDDASKAVEMYDTIVDKGKGIGKISALAEATGGRFVLSKLFIGTLFSYTGFTELRIRCFKPWHGRTAHFVLSGEPLANALFRSTVTHGSCAPIRFLPGDDSNFSRVTCDRIRLGFNNQNVEIYYLLICDRLHEFVFQLQRNHFDCDDSVVQSGSTLAGSWQYYVR